MMLSRWHRRRAERLAQLLDEASSGRRHRGHSPLDDQLTDLVRLGHHLASTELPQPDPVFRVGLRAMLLAAAGAPASPAAASPPTDPIPRPRRPPSTLGRGPRARTTVITGVTIGAVAFAGMSTASADAAPGDALYGVKRSTERAHLALAGSDVGRAQLYLDFAWTRLAEAGAVTDGLARVLDDMDRDTADGVRLLTTAATNRQDPAALDAIDPFVTRQREILTELAAGATGAELPRVAASLQLLDKINERTGDLRRGLRAGCQMAASIDALGPQPGRCHAVPMPAPAEPPADHPPRPPAGPPWRPDYWSAPAPPSLDRHADQDDAAAPVAVDPGSGLPASVAPAAPDPAAGATRPESDPPSRTAPAHPDEASSHGLWHRVNRLLGDLLGG